MAVKPLLYLLLIPLLISMANAGTVNMAASCYSSIVSHNGTKYVNVTVSNLHSSSDSATDMLITAVSPGLNSNTVNNVTILLPGNSDTFKFYVSNATQNGTYAFTVHVLYTEGLQNFVVVFPCLVNQSAGTVSLLRVENISVKNNYLRASIINLAPYSINASAYFVSPPVLKVSSNKTQFTVQPNAEYQIESAINESTLSNAIVTVSAFVSYTRASNTYTAMQTLPLNINPTPSSSGININTIIIVLPITIIVILIVISVLVNRAKKNKSNQVNQ